MPTTAKKYGSIAILTTIFTGLAVAIIFNTGSWAVGQINNVAPVVTAVENLTKVMTKNQNSSDIQFAAMTAMIYEQNIRLEVDEHRLNTVETIIEKHEHSHKGY